MNEVVGTVQDGKRGWNPTRQTDPEPWRHLGYIPWPGTLNVNVGRDNRDWIARQAGVFGPTGTKFVPVDIHGIAGHVRFTSNKDLAEVVAAVHLRTALGLSNGDRVTLRLR